MINTDALSAQLGFSKNDEPLTGRDHFLHVMQIEPTADDRLAQSVCLRFFQCCLKYYFPTAESSQLRFCHFTAQTNRLLRLLMRKTLKLAAILMSSRKVREQIFHRLDF